MKTSHAVSSWRCFACAIVSTFALVPQSHAHNLDTRATSISFAQDFVATMSSRAASMQQPVQIGDEFWVILKTTPGPGTDIGVGGYQTFYIPDGVQVVDAAYMRPNSADPKGFTAIPMKGQSPIAIGAGAIGAKAAIGLTGFTYPSANILGVNNAPVTAGGISRGTIAGVYADTGIFYSTDADTAFNSYGAAPVGGPAPMKNNSGDTVGEWDAANVAGSEVLGVMTTWDSYQLRAFGRNDVSPIIDAADGRGNAPWGMASAVAGPESGYKWAFNYASYLSAGGNAAAISSAIKVGPWNRIKYLGSQVSKDIAGSTSTTLGYAGVDASFIGRDFVTAGALPTTTKSIRFAIGQLELGRAEYSAVKIRINSLPSAQCYKMYADAFGGDAGGDFIGKDHIWRYFDPTVVSLQACVALQKVVTKGVIVKGDTTSFKLTFANLQGVTLPNVSLIDTLPAGLTYQGATPAPTSISGGNPAWFLGNIAPGTVKEFTVTVVGNAVGTFFNKVTALSNGSTVAVAEDSVVVGEIPLLRKEKTVTPSIVAPGDNVTYSLVVTNDGTLTNPVPMTLREFLPPGFTYGSLVDAKINGVAITPTVVSTDNTQPVITVNQGIPAGQSLVLRFVSNIDAYQSPGTYLNSFSVEYGAITLGPVPEAPVIVAGGRIGDTIFRDWNGNGTQDSGEEGMPDVTVTLTNYGADGLPGGVGLNADTVTTKVTDSNGYYLFTGLLAGNYQVRVPGAGAGGVPTGYTLTADPNGAPVNAAFPLTLNTDQQFLTADFGYKPGGSGSIGDTVFEDVNNDGAQGAADAGIPEISVYLYEDTSGNGVIDADDVIVATKATRTDGTYLFAGLATGISYVVQVDQADTDLTTYFSPNPYQISTAPTKAVPNLSGSVLTADFGFWPLLPSSIGDTVFKDVNGNGIYDLGIDVPLANITVSLFRDLNDNGVADNGELTGTTSTDYAGQYSFTRLGPDRYIVVVNASDADLPGGLAPTKNNIVVELGVGEDVTTADFPFIFTLSKLVDLSVANPGNTLNYTIVPNYPGQSLLSNVKVTDVVPAGTNFLSVAQGGTQSGGTVTWNLGSNAGGVVGVGGSLADSATLGDATSETLRDTYIDESSSDANNGADAELWVKPDAGKNKRALVQWDLSLIPAGATITKASVQFWVRSTKAQTVTLHRVTKDWDGGASNNADGADWTKADDAPVDIFWTTLGGDFDTSSLGTFSASTTGSKTVTSSALKALVQAWVNGTTTNQGILLTTAGANGDAKLGSSENTTAAKRPQLILSYYPNGASSTSTDIVTSTPLVGGSGPQSITVTMNVFVSGNSTTETVTPPTNLTPTGTNVGIISKSSGPTPASIIIPFGGGMASFSWVYLVTPGIIPGSVKFNGAASASGLTLNNAVSPSVIVSPPLTFAVTVKNPLTTNSVKNVAVIQSDTVIPPTNSPIARTALTASIGDKVFADLNGNGVQDSGEPGLGGIEVIVTKGASTYNATTDGNGDYRIYGLSAGTWTVTLNPATVPANYLPTLIAAPVNLGATQQYDDADFGLRPPPAVPSSIGDTLWIDSNENGIKESDENGIPNITVKLYRDVNGNGVIDSGDLLIRTTQTDANGVYGFGFLYSGNYIVDADETDPDFTAGLELVSGGAQPSTLYKVTLASAQNLTTVDFGYNYAGKIGDFVWWDYNGNGAYDPSLGETPITAANPSLGVLVFLFEDTNNNGSYDVSDQQIATGNVATDGYYLFDNLPPRRYFVEIYDESVDAQGGEDEDFVYTTPKIQTVNLAPGQSYLNADFGINLPTFVNGHLYIDTNGNGVQDGAEPNLPNVNVVVTDRNGVSQIVVTDSLGNWIATVMPGSTSANVDETDPDYPAGYLQTEGTDPTTVTAIAGAHTDTGNDGYYLSGGISGAVFVGTTGLPGVTVTLVDSAGNPADGDSVTPGIQPITRVTDSNGAYSFLNLPPGLYGVKETQPVGYMSVSDKDGGDPDEIRPISVTAGATNTGNDFIEAVDTCPDDWTEWKFQHPGQTAGGNPESDAYDNFAEFAFAMPYDNGVGSQWLNQQTAWIIRPSTIAPGTIEGVFIRPKGAPDNVSYILQSAPIIGNPMQWQDLTLTPGMFTAVDNGDCTETITIHGLAGLTGNTGGTGVVRIKAVLDDNGNHDGDIDHISYTETEGWTETNLAICCQTYSVPYLRETIFSGTVGQVSGQDLIFPGDVLDGLLKTGVAYQLEVTSGVNVGQRFDVVFTGGNFVTLASDTDIYGAFAPFNTIPGAPPLNLAGCAVVLRPHWTLGGLFPRSGFVAGNSQVNSDQVQTYAGGAWTTYWLYDQGDADPTTSRWVKIADDPMSDQAGVVIPPGQGMFVIKRGTAATLLSYGEIRPNDFIRPLRPGTDSNLVGSGYPLDQAFRGTGSRQMNLAATPTPGFFGSRDFKTADSVLLWKGDATVGGNGYDTYYLLSNTSPAALKWVKVGDATLLSRDSEVLFLKNRATFVRSKNAYSNYRIPAPWAP